MTERPQDTSAEEPDGGTPHIRFRGGPGLLNSNGQRFTRYLIVAARSSGAVLLNGAADCCAAVGDLLIICAYSMYSSEAELESYRLIVVLCDAQNRRHKAHFARSADSVVP